ARGCHRPRGSAGRAPWGHPTSASGRRSRDAGGDARGPTSDTRLMTLAARRLAVVAALGVGVVAALSITSDLGEIGSRLAGFAWPAFVVALGLALVNYAVRFVRWQLYLR